MSDAPALELQDKAEQEQELRGFHSIREESHADMKLTPGIQTVYYN